MNQQAQRAQRPQQQAQQLVLRRRVREKSGTSSGHVTLPKPAVPQGAERERMGVLPPLTWLALGRPGSR